MNPAGGTAPENAPGADAHPRAESGFRAPTLRRNSPGAAAGWGTEVKLALLLAACMVVALTVREARLGIAVAMGGVFVGMAFLRIELAITLFLLYLVAPPLVPPSILGGIPGLNPETIMLAVLLACAVRRARAGGGEIARPRNPIGVPLLVFSALGVGSAFISPFWNVPLIASLTNTKQFLMPLVLVPVIANGIRTRDEALRLFYGFLAVVGFLTAYSLRDVAHGFANPRFRLDTFIGHPNEFGALLVLCGSVIGTALLARGATRPVRAVLMWLTFSTSVSLLWTLSRGSILGALAGLVVLGTIYSRKFLAALLLALALAPWWVPERVLNRFEETTEEGERSQGFGVDGSTAVRLEQWSSLPRMMATSPIFGHGIETFGPVNRWVGTYRWQGAHSSWVRVLVEMGIAGCSCLVWAFIAAWLMALDVMRRGTDFLSRAIGPGMVAALPAVVVVNASGQRLYHEINSSFLWFLTGLLVVVWRLLPDPAARARRIPFSAEVEGTTAGFFRRPDGRTR